MGEGVTGDTWICLRSVISVLLSARNHLSVRYIKSRYIEVSLR
jgi:hypothetical protein